MQFESVNLFYGKNDKDEDDPAFIISDTDDMPNFIYGKRMQIKEGFRDLKTLFGFRHLVLKKPKQETVCNLNSSPYWQDCLRLEPPPDKASRKNSLS